MTNEIVEQLPTGCWRVIHRPALAFCHYRTRDNAKLAANEPDAEAMTRWYQESQPHAVEMCVRWKLIEGRPLTAEEGKFLEDYKAR